MSCCPHTALSRCLTSMSYFFIRIAHPSPFLFFFFNDTATTEIYTLSLHDALPISQRAGAADDLPEAREAVRRQGVHVGGDRKSTRLNSSHQIISYAVFCLKKKK